MDKHLKIDISKATSSKLGTTNFDELAFGQITSDHMLVADGKTLK